MGKKKIKKIWLKSVFLGFSRSQYHYFPTVPLSLWENVPLANSTWITLVFMFCSLYGGETHGKGGASSCLTQLFPPSPCKCCHFNDKTCFQKISVWRMRNSGTGSCSGVETSAVSCCTSTPDLSEPPSAVLTNSQSTELMDEVTKLIQFIFGWFITFGFDLDQFSI